jgi:HSP20 family molecular chaperone IbpA
MPNARCNVQYVTPDVNIYEAKDGYVLEAEMPGVNKDGLEITLEGHQITITGGRRTRSWPAKRCSANGMARIIAACSISIRRLIPRALRPG